MRAVIQRVSEASVTINNKITGSIRHGLLVLIGIEDPDTDEDIAWLSNKIINLRIFDDDNGVMNKSLKDINGEILLVSQFTLYAATKKGNRPLLHQGKQAGYCRSALRKHDTNAGKGSR